MLVALAAWHGGCVCRCTCALLAVILRRAELFFAWALGVDVVQTINMHAGDQHHTDGHAVHSAAMQCMRGSTKLGVRHLAWTQLAWTSCKR
jgi:hypothetical protein